MNMTKAVYEVVTVTKSPFVMYDEKTNRYSGMLVDLLNEIARRLSFDYKIRLESDLEYGYMDEEGNWNGMIREMQEKKADIGLGAVSLMSERMKVVDFTEPVYKPTGISVLMRKPIVQTAFFRFLTVLETDVWLCIVGAYLFTSFLLWIFDTWSPYSYQNNKEKYKNDPEKRIFTLKESLWFCLTSLTPQGGGEAPKNLSGRLVAATWWLFGFIIIASYTANLAAFLTITRFEKQIESFDDLISQYRYSYTVIENSTTYRYFKRMHDIEYRCYEMWKDMTLNDSLTPFERAQLAVWEYPLSDKFIKIYSAVTHNKMYKNLKEALDQLEPRSSRYTLIAEATDVKYHAMTNCGFKEIGPEFSKKPYALVLQKNSPLTSKFNDVIMELYQEDWMSVNEEKWWKFNPSRQVCYDSDEVNSGIIMKNIGGVFVLIGIGITVATLTLIYEFFYFKYFCEDFERFYDEKMEKFKSCIYKQAKFRRFVAKP